MKQYPTLSVQGVTGKLRRSWIWIGAAIAMAPLLAGIGKAQTALPSNSNVVESSSTLRASCETIQALPIRKALSRACLPNATLNNAPARNAIIVGFVGGLVKSTDVKHPEVIFAELLRDSRSSVVHAEVFANHDGKGAHRRVLQLLDTNEDGELTTSEKEQASIIIYGHSWGASQAVTLARELGREGVPVLLTIQVDSVRKPGQDDSIIPSNVKNAVNFYQTRGIIHGRSVIRAADPERTNILGNFRMTYAHKQIDCSNYPWLPRVFNRPHHEIENDPLIWDQIASLIASELSSQPAIVDTSLALSSRSH